MEIHKVSKSAIYLRTEKKIKDTFGTLEKNNITPWASFNSGKPFQVKKFDGSKIVLSSAETLPFMNSITGVSYLSVFWILTLLGYPLPRNL
jgi:hypothetical protein